jgi:hypothetical protein
MLTQEISDFFRKQESGMMRAGERFAIWPLLLFPLSRSVLYGMRHDRNAAISDMERERPFPVNECRDNNDSKHERQLRTAQHCGALRPTRYTAIIMDIGRSLLKNVTPLREQGTDWSVGARPSRAAAVRSGSILCPLAPPSSRGYVLLAGFSGLAAQTTSALIRTARAAWRHSKQLRNWPRSRLSRWS